MVIYRHPKHGRRILERGDDPRALEAAGWVREDAPTTPPPHPPPAPEPVQEAIPTAPEVVQAVPEPLPQPRPVQPDRGPWRNRRGR